MASIQLNREQQGFLCEIFETRDVVFAFEKFQNMLIDLEVDTLDSAVYLNRLIKRYNERMGR